MYDDDLDALAAEYVLGTLSAEERTHAEVMIGMDQGFVEIVRQWERRLGELNVMVEAVEPPAKIWDEIKSGIGAATQNEAIALPALPPIAADMETETEAGAEPEAGAKSENGEPSPLLGAPAAGELTPEIEASPETEAEAEAETEAKAQPQPQPQSEATAESAEPEALAESAEPEAPAEPAEAEAPSLTPFTLLPPVPAAPAEIQPSADVISLTRRARGWRRLAFGCGALAAALAAFIVVSQVKPELIPAGRFHIPQLIAGSAPPPAPTAAPAASQLVAVLQQAPSAPAFLLTVDPAARMMTVRAVAAKAAADHSFELWLIGPQASTPQSLGLIGGTEYTQRPLPAGLDAAALQAATYAVSFEPAGGSKTGAPSGPILFTGKLVQSVPTPPQPTPKT